MYVIVQKEDGSSGGVMLLRETAPLDRRMGIGPGTELASLPKCAIITCLPVVIFAERPPCLKHICPVVLQRSREDNERFKVTEHGKACARTTGTHRNPTG